MKVYFIPKGTQVLGTWTDGGAGQEQLQANIDMKHTLKDVKFTENDVNVLLSKQYSGRPGPRPEALVFNLPENDRKIKSIAFPRNFVFLKDV